MTAEKCHTCVYYDELFGADDDDPAKGLCYFPSALLPLSMAGYANRERETVEANATGCPTWTASAQPAQAVAEVGQQFRVWLETVVLANSEDEALAKLVDPKCSSIPGAQSMSAPASGRLRGHPISTAIVTVLKAPRLQGASG